MKEICEKHGIQSRGTYGEHTASVGGVYDLSNKRRLGLTELEAVTEMYKGVSFLLDLERQMQAYNKGAPGKQGWYYVCFSTNPEERSYLVRCLTLGGLIIWSWIFL